MTLYISETLLTFLGGGLWPKYEVELKLDYEGEYEECLKLDEAKL